MKARTALLAGLALVAPLLYRYARLVAATAAGEYAHRAECELILVAHEAAQGKDGVLRSVPA